MPQPVEVHYIDWPEALLWAAIGVVVSRVLTVGRVLGEEHQRELQRPPESRRSREQILLSTISWKNWYFWLATACLVLAGVFVVALWGRSGVRMTPQLAVYMGAAAPALLGDFFKSIVPPSGPIPQAATPAGPPTTTPPKGRKPRGGPKRGSGADPAPE